MKSSETVAALLGLATGSVCLSKESHRIQGVIKWGHEPFTHTEG